MEVFSPTSRLHFSTSPLNGLEYEFVPSELDNIAPGTYTFSAWVERSRSPSGPLELGWHEQTITVRPTEHGKVLDASSFGRVIIPGSAKGRTLLALAGFEIEHNTVAAVPTPHTVEAACQQQGLAVRLLPHMGEIGCGDYLQAFADGMYPVATGDEEYYFHDIGNDHMTAMVLGGQQLSDALGVAARQALQDAPECQGMIAGNIDKYTSLLRSICLEAGEDVRFIRGFFGPSLTAELQGIGTILGIANTQTSAIIKLVQDTAREYGVDVPALD